MAAASTGWIPKQVGSGITPPPTGFLWAASWSHFAIAAGDVWFGTTHGLARLEPVADVVRAPPPILLTGLQIAGVARRMSQLGETRIAGLQLRPDQRDIQVDFVGLTHEAGESLQYEYQLDGDTRGWIRLGDQRRITFANLRSGRYRSLRSCHRHRWRA